MKKKIKIIIFFYALFFFICMPEFVSAYTTNDFSINEDLDFNNCIPQWVYDNNLHYFLVYSYDSNNHVGYAFYVYSGEVVASDDYTFLSKSSNSRFYYYNAAFSSYNYSKTQVINTLKSCTINNNIKNSKAYLDYAFENVVGNVYYISDVDIKFSNGGFAFKDTIIPPVVYPEILNNVEDLELLNFEYLQINANDFSKDSFYIYNYDLNGFTDEQIELHQYALGLKNSILLNTDSKYYNADLSTEDNSIYWIPKSDLGFSWKNKGSYLFQFVSSHIEGEGEEELDYLDEIGESVKFTLADGVALSQIEQANQEKQIEQNKNIFQKIGDILSFINPLSENFFVYKLLDLLYEGLKALFIPSNEFFTDWFTDLNDNFADQFGILYYPVSVIIEFLGDLNVNLVEHEPIINTPDLQLHLFGHDYTLIGASSYNFNTLLETPEFATAHSWYLFFTNVMFTIGVVAYAGKIAAEIFGGIDDSANSYFDIDNENGAYGDLAVGRDYNRRLTSYDRNQKVKRFRNSSYVSRGRPNKIRYVSYDKSFRR